MDFLLADAIDGLIAVETGAPGMAAAIDRLAYALGETAFHANERPLTDVADRVAVARVKWQKRR